MALASPGLSSAAKPRGAVAALAAGDCILEKGAIGKRAFRKRWGPKRPMAACTRARLPEARRAVAVATAACQEELDAYGPDEFLVEWASWDECVLTYAEWEMDGGLVDAPEEVEGPGDEGVE